MCEKREKYTKKTECQHHPDEAVIFCSRCKKSGYQIAIEYCAARMAAASGVTTEYAKDAIESVLSEPRLLIIDEAWSDQPEKLETWRDRPPLL